MKGCKIRNAETKCKQFVWFHETIDSFDELLDPKGVRGIWRWVLGGSSHDL